MSEATADFMEMWGRLAVEKPSEALAVSLVIHKLSTGEGDVHALMRRALNPSLEDHRVLELLNLMLRVPGRNKDRRGRFRKPPTKDQYIHELLIVIQRLPEFAGEAEQTSIAYYLSLCAEQEQAGQQ